CNGISNIVLAVTSMVICNTNNNKAMIATNDERPESCDRVRRNMSVHLIQVEETRQSMLPGHSINPFRMMLHRSWSTDCPSRSLSDLQRNQHPGPATPTS